jgi:hypothetical protein
MPDLAALGIDRAVVKCMHDEWRAGGSKSERKCSLGKVDSRDKLFPALIQQFL